MKPEVIYLAGPMTGLPLYNYDAFMAAKKALEAGGYKVLTPFDANNEVWNRHFGRDFNPYEDKCDWGDPKLGEIVLVNQGYIVSCDTICLLPMWINSKGTKQEVVFGTNLGKKTMLYETEKYINIRYDLSFFIT